MFILDLHLQWKVWWLTVFSQMHLNMRVCWFRLRLLPKMGAKAPPEPIVIAHLIYIHISCIFLQTGITLHDDVIKWKDFPRYWPFVRGFHRSPNARSAQRPDLRLNNGCVKQSWGWWFETPTRSLWRHCNAKHALQASKYTWTTRGLQSDIMLHLIIFLVGIAN